MGAEWLGGIGMTRCHIGWTADPHEYIRPEGRHTRLASILAAVAAGNEPPAILQATPPLPQANNPPTGPSYRGIAAPDAYPTRTDHRRHAAAIARHPARCASDLAQEHQPECAAGALSPARWWLRGLPRRRRGA